MKYSQLNEDTWETKNEKVGDGVALKALMYSVTDWPYTIILLHIRFIIIYIYIYIYTPKKGIDIMFEGPEKKKKKI